MTSVSDNITAIEKAMEGVTPGLWAAGYSSPGARSRYIYANNGAILEIRDSEGRADSQAIATFIAACSPDRMREVLALARQAAALQQEVDSLKQTRQHSREASAALHDAFMEERKRAEALKRENAELRKTLAGDHEIKPLSEDRLEEILEFEERFKMLGGAGDTASLDWATQCALINEAVLACRARALLGGENADN